MTKKGFFRKLTGKLTIILAVIALISLSAFLFVACGGNSSGTTSEKTYTYSGTDTSPISNMSFDYSTEDLAKDKFPYSTSTWSRSLDNGAKTSQVDSGVIDISEDGWAALMEKLYADQDFLYFAGNKYDSNSGYPSGRSAIEIALRAHYGNDIEITDDNVDELFKKFVIETFGTSAGIKRPVRDGMNDTKVYMLNNYMSKSSTELGFGTAQVISSSSSVTLKKGKYAEISVWIMTQSVSGKNADGEYGANIRLINTINGKSQAQYRISNIVTNGEWKQYKIYVKADDSYDTTIKLVLGLGYGSGSSDEGYYYTEGTVYFDDVSYKVLDNLDELDVKTVFGVSDLDYGAEQPIANDARTFDADTQYFFYNLSIDATFALPKYAGYIQDAAATVSGDYTKAKGTFDPAITSETLFNGSNSATCEFDATENAYKVSGLNYSAYSVMITDANFTLDNGEYAVVTFKIKNALSKLGDTSVTVSLIDKFGDVTEKRSGLVSASTVSDEYKTVRIIVKNNFADAANDGRTFAILIEIGPMDDKLAAVTDRTACPRDGEVYITSPTIAKGVIKDEDADTYNLYTFFVSVADKEQALYAGYTADYSENSSGSTSYSFTPSSGNLGEITAYPTNLQNYKGIVSNHFYVKNGTDLEKDINTRSGNGEDGSYAGLINTKYLTAYAANTTIDIAGALAGKYTDDIQPLMIYNNNADHYGYVGESNTIAVSAYASVSLKVRVVGDAKAYIYLVDVSNEGKQVLKFVDFTSNGNKINGSLFNYALVIDGTMMDSDGWAEVSFYIANGKNERKFRLEMWNGSRSGEAETASAGYVFYKDVSIQTSGAFTEASRFADSFTDASTPLGKATRNAFTGDGTQLYSYSYGNGESDISYVWAKNDTMIYSVLNTIEKVETTENKEENNSSESTGCAAKTDASTFWLSFSSILLAVVLVLSIIALFIKNIKRRGGFRKKEIKSHYSVQSRNKALKDAKAKKDNLKLAESAEDIADAEESTEETEEVPETEEETSAPDGETTEETTLDEYVYGEVTDFGETETNEEKPEETDDSSEKKDD